MHKNGVPSEATLCRIENGIDDLALADKMQEFVASIHRELLKDFCDKEIISVDGKAMRGTIQPNGRNPDIVSAYSFKTGESTTEKRLYVSSLPTVTPSLGYFVRNHWSIESMHWGLDFNFQQDKIKRKTSKAARNLDTLQRIIYSVFATWKKLRKKRSDKRKGIAEIMRHISMSFTKLIKFLSQKIKK